MASSSADCVLAGARLISSASKMFVKTGPRRSVKVLEARSNTFVPVMSEGMRSGVNCTRPKPALTSRARVLAMRVLAVPGTPSSSTCPPVKSATSICWKASSWPTTTLAASARISA